MGWWHSAGAASFCNEQLIVLAALANGLSFAVIASYRHARNFGLSLRPRRQ